jgi:hypothetical protein
VTAHSDLPLADPGRVEQVRSMVAEGLSPEEYAARWAHKIDCFSLDEYAYEDAALHAWIHALGAIVFGKPGAPALDELRRRLLTPAEREAIHREMEEVP